MKTLPGEFRHRVLALIDDGITASEIAEILGTNATWVRSIKALHKKGPSIEPKSRANKRPALTSRDSRPAAEQPAATTARPGGAARAAAAPAEVGICSTGG